MNSPADAYAKREFEAAQRTMLGMVVGIWMVVGILFAATVLASIAWIFWR